MFRGVILLVDRFSGMNSLISSYLTASGFDVCCMQSVDGITAEALSSAHLVLMDIDTAGDRLSEIAGRLSAAGIPLVVLTSEHDSDGRLTALEMGAADVMSRPLDMAELTARVRAADRKDAAVGAVREAPSGQLRRTYRRHYAVPGDVGRRGA